MMKLLLDLRGIKMNKILLLLFFMFSVAAKEKIAPKIAAQLKEILASNDVLHDKFYQYNAVEIEAQKDDVAKLIAKFNGHEQILDLLKKSSVPLSKISKSSTEAENKKQFSIFNSVIVRIISDYEVDDKYKAYYCPMVRKKWVQDTAKKAGVNNPYDASMPDCGGRL